MLWTKCHNSKRLPSSRLPRLHLLVPHFRLTLSAPSHSPPLYIWISPPLREIVGSHSHISSYQLSPGCASRRDLVSGMVPTCKKSSHLLLDTPTEPRIPNHYRAWSSAAIEWTPTSLRGPFPISTPCCPTRSLSRCHALCTCGVLCQ